MKLDEFISSTLVDIQNGVLNAIKKTKEQGISGAINPVWGEPKDIGPDNIENVSFDIAVTVIDKSSGSASAGVKVVGIGVDGEKVKSKENSHISRIQFSIPVVQPVTTVK